MVQLTILAGSFTTFIATYVFNSDTNTLSLTHQSETGPSPSWITSHHTNKSVLYAVNEDWSGAEGKLQSFTVDATGVLTLVDEATTHGIGPTYVESLSTGEVTGCNYGSPSVAFVGTNPDDPARFTESIPVNFTVTEGDPSNPHMSLEYNDEILIPDLAQNKIWRVGRDAEGAFEQQGKLDVPGNGPRHIAIQDDVLFVLNEKNSMLTVHQLPDGTPITTASILPEEAANLKTRFAAAEIVIASSTDPENPSTLIYVSNRNIGPEKIEAGIDETALYHPDEDTIAIFEWSNSTLTLLKHVHTGLRQIRSFALGPEDTKEYLIAGGAEKGGVAMYRRIDGGRDLEFIDGNNEFNATSFVFL